MTLMNYVQQGGTIMYILIALNIIGFTILIWKAVAIIGFKNKINATSEEIKGEAEKLAQEPATTAVFIKDEVQSRVHSLEGGLNTLKIIASISPLLGLLGTVIGILSAFQTIATKGLNDPSFFAGGIAMALVTTVGGLIVAIPHFIAYNYFVSSLDDLEIVLEKKLLKKLFYSKA